MDSTEHHDEGAACARGSAAGGRACRCEAARRAARVPRDDVREGRQRWLDFRARWAREWAEEIYREDLDRDDDFGRDAREACEQVIADLTRDRPEHPSAWPLFCDSMVTHLRLAWPDFTDSQVTETRVASPDVEVVIYVKPGLPIVHIAAAGWQGVQHCRAFAMHLHAGRWLFAGPAGLSVAPESPDGLSQ